MAAGDNCSGNDEGKRTIPNLPNLRTLNISTELAIRKTTYHVTPFKIPKKNNKSGRP